MSKVSPKVSIRRDTLEWKVLNFIEDAGQLAADIWLPQQYSNAKLLRSILGVDCKKKFSEKEKAKLKVFVSSALSRLKTKGLVWKRRGSTRKALWQLTNLGRVSLQEEKINLPLEDGRLRIFIFDIAEHRKHDREWVRNMLISAGFAMLQRSVWIGRRPLPEIFLQDINERGLFEDVHFFEVQESGTLENLDWKERR